MVRATNNRKGKTGHNSLAVDALKSTIERVERLEEEKANLSLDIREVFAEAKGNGLDVKAIRAIIKSRKQDANERAEHMAVMKIYCDALGMPDPFS